MSAAQVKYLAWQLRLFGVHAAFERRASEAVAQQLHPLEFLQLLLEEEALSRKERAGKILTARAKFRRAADLEDWDASFDRGLSKHAFKELASLSFFHNTENLLLFGKTGEGKTHLAISLGRRLCTEGQASLFFPVGHLFEEIAAAKAAGKYLPFLKTVSKAKVLILDDFGMRPYSHEEATSLLEILEERYLRGAVIITSQVDDRGWRKLFEDAVVAEAITDRLTQPAQKLVLTGGSYRERMAKNSKRNLPKAI
jgi:DNA replication protein DnaC